MEVANRYADDKRRLEVPDLRNIEETTYFLRNEAHLSTT